jgi:regulator of PEP synthase PpsR (kinase-PPPase family)
MSTETIGKKHIPLYLISDSTGDTVNGFARAAMAQFAGVEVEEHSWCLVRTHAQLDRILELIQKNPGPVLYTMVDRELRHKLKRHCAELKVPCIAILTRVVQELSDYLQVKSTPFPGRQHALDEKYFERVEAITYALAHDDGQSVDHIEHAHIVLVGVSRTSKTPTCVYLAYRGYRSANIPYVRGRPIAESVVQSKRPLVVGLTISPERLVQIRSSRLLSLHDVSNSSYVDMEDVKEEIAEARREFTRHGWPLIDVSRKSIEETVATIIQMYHAREEKLRSAP